MNILSVGVDMEETNRFRIMNDDFIKKIFTDNEIKYCKSQRNYHQNYAARFVAKEATKKALSSIGINISFKDIEIIRENGHPEVKINNEDIKHLKIKLSLSHANKSAIAFVVVTN